MTVVITLDKKGLHFDAFAKKMRELVNKHWPESRLTITKKERAESRTDRFDEALEMIAEAQGTFKKLREELQEWRDNLPENLQSSQRADDLDSAILELEDAISKAEDLKGSEVNFPGMFG